MVRWGIWPIPLPLRTPDRLPGKVVTASVEQRVTLVEAPMGWELAVAVSQVPFPGLHTIVPRILQELRQCRNVKVSPQQRLSKVGSLRYPS